MDKTLQVKVSMMVDLQEASNDIAKEINKLTVPDIPIKLKIAPISDEQLKNINFDGIKRKLNNAFILDNEIANNLNTFGSNLTKILDTNLDNRKLSQLNELTEVFSRISSNARIDNSAIQSFNQGISSIRSFVDTCGYATRVLGNVEGKIIGRGADVFEGLAESLSGIAESFDINEETFNKFKIMNNMLTEFNKLSKEAQNALVKKSKSSSSGSIDDLSDTLKTESKLAVDEFYSAVPDMSEAINKRIIKNAKEQANIMNAGSKILADAIEDGEKAKLKSITTYLDSSDGILEVTRKQLNDWTVLTEQTFHDGGKVGKLTVNLESYMDKTNKLYKEASDSATKYNIAIHKALRQGDTDQVAYLETIKSEFDNIKKKMKSEIMNTPFADQLMSTFANTDIKNNRIREYETLKFDDIFDKKELKSFTSEYQKIIKEIESYEKDLLKALSQGEYDYASDIQTRIDALQKESEQLLENAKSLKEHKKALESARKIEGKSNSNVDLYSSYLANKNSLIEEQAVQKEQQAILKENEKQRQASLKAQVDSNKEYWNEIVKAEAQIIKGYESVTKTLTDYQNKYFSAMAEGDTTKADGYVDSILYWSKRLNELQDIIDNNKFTSDFYSKIEDIDKRDDLAVQEFESKLASKVEKQTAKNNKAREDELIKTYKELTSKLTKKENELLKKVMENDGVNTDEFQKIVDGYKADVNDFISKIDFNDYSSALKQKFAEIDIENSNTTSEFVAKLDDSLKDKLVKENEVLKKDLIKRYEDISSAITSKESKLIKAIAKDDEYSIEALNSSLETLYKKQEEVINKIQKSGLKDVLQAQMNNINEARTIKLVETGASISDQLASKQLKEENNELKNLVAKYKSNATELANAKKLLLTTDEGETSSVIKKRINELEQEQESIKKNAEAYSDYADAISKIESIQKSSDYSVSLATAKNNDKKVSEKVKEVEKQEKAVLEVYEKYATLVAKTEKDILSASLKNDHSTAIALEKNLEVYSDIKKKIETQIKDSGLDEIYKDKLNSINQKIELDFSVDMAKLEDSFNKNLNKEQTKELNDYVSKYRSLYKDLTNEKIKIAKLNAEQRTEEVKIHEAELKSLQAQLSNHKATASRLALEKKANVKTSDIEKYYNTILSTEEARLSDSKRLKDEKNSLSQLKKEQDELLARYKTLIKQKQALERELSTTSKGEGFDKLNSDLEKVNAQIKEVFSKITSSNHLEKLKIFSDDNELSKGMEYIKVVENIESEVKSLLTVVDKLRTSEFIDKDSLALVEAKLKGISDIDFYGTVVDISEVNSELKQTSELLDEIQSTKSLKLFESDKSIKLDELDQAISKFKKDFGGVLDDASFEHLESSAKKLANVMDKESFSQGAKELTAQLKKARNEMDNLVKTSDRYNFFEDLYDNMRTYQLGDIIVDGVQEAVSSVKDIVIGLDDAMANVKKVAIPVDVSSIDKLDEIKSKAIEISKEVGMASEDVINSIADTIQTSGYRMEEAMEIARQTMMLANVGDMTAESATQGVVSILAGFNLNPLREMQVEVDGAVKSTNELTDAMDKINYVGNNFAISTEGILNAMQSGATVLNSYGVSMNDTIAMITGANKTLQDPSVVGNGLKSISINLAGIKSDAYTGEIALNKTAMALEEIAGINVFSNKQKTEVKDMMQILDELYKQWDTLTEVEQLGLAEAIAGKQQSKVFQSLMTNFEDVIAVRDEFNQGFHFGSAEKENAQYLDSISGKLNTLKETWVSILDTFAKSDSIKGILDILISLSEAIDSVVKSLDSSGNLLTGTLGALFSGGDLLKNLAGANDNKVFSMEKVGDSFQIIQTEGVKTNSIFKDISKSMKEGTSVSSKLGNGMKTLGKNIASSVIPSLKSMATAGLKGIAVGLAFKGVSWVMENVINKYDTMEKKIADNIESLESEVDSLNSQKKAISEIAKEYDELAKKKNKTEEEVQKFSELKSTIATTMPELVGGYDENGDPILMLKGSAEDLVKELEKAVAEKKELIKLEQESDAKLASEQISKTKENLESARKNLETNYNSTQGVNKDTINSVMIGSLSVKDLKSKLDTQEKEYAKFYEKIKEHAQNYREDEIRLQQSTLNHLYDTDLYKGLKDDTLKQSINSWASAFDWGEFTNSAERIEIIENLSEAMANGKLDVEKWTKAWEDANDAFELTGNEEEYTKNLQGLANELERLTGIDASTWMKGLTQEFDGLSYAEEKLNNFLEAMGSSRIELANGDSLAVQLKKQFDDLNNFLEYGVDQNDLEVVFDLYTKVNEGKIYENLPKEIKEIINKAIKDGKVTEEEHSVVMSLTSAISNGGTFSKEVAEKINRLLKGELTEKELSVPLKINDDVSLGTYTLSKLQEYFKQNPLGVDLKVEEGNEPVANALSEAQSFLNNNPLKAPFTVSGTEGLNQTKEKVNETQGHLNGNPLTSNVKVNDTGNIDQVKTKVNDTQNYLNSNPLKTHFEVHGNESIDESKEKIEGLNDGIKEFRDNKNIDVLVGVVGQEQADLVVETIRKLQASPEITNKLILGLAEEGQLSKFKNYTELWDWLQANPTVATEYGITVTGAEESKKKVEEVNKELDTLQKAEDTSINVESNANVTANDLKDLIEFSAKVEEGQYKITFTAEVETAKTNIDNLCTSLQTLTDNFSQSHTVTFNAETAQSAKNISGLITRVKEIKKLNGKTFKYYAETAQSAKNISGLIKRIEEINKLNGKTFTWNANTGQAVTNIGNLITKIDEINGRSSKSFSYNVNTNYTSTGNSGGLTGEGGGLQSLDTESVSYSEPSISRSVTPTSTEVSSPVTLSANSVDMRAIATAFNSIDLSAIAFDMSKMKMPSTESKDENKIEIKNENIVFNSPLIHIEGNVDQDVMADLQKFGNKLKKEIVSEIKNGDVRKKRLEGSK